MATVGRRAGRAGAGGHFLPGSAQFCKGSAARAGGAGAGSGRETHARARPAEGRGEADKGRGRAGERDRAPVPPSFSSVPDASACQLFPRHPRRPTSATFKVLTLEVELPFPVTRPAPHLHPLGPHEPLPSTPGDRPHPSRLQIPSRGLSWGRLSVQL